MAKGPEIPKTDSAEIEILIERLKQNKLERRDVELIERLLRTVMVLVNLLQRKNMSIKRLRDLIFGRRTEKRKTGSGSQPEDKPEEGATNHPVTEREASERSQHERQAAGQRARAKSDAPISRSEEDRMPARTIPSRSQMPGRRM